MADEEFDNDSVHAEEDGYFRQPTSQPGQYPTSPIGRNSPWSTPGSNDWRAQLGGNVPHNIAPGNGVDDVALALSALELQQQQYGGNNYQQGMLLHLCYSPQRTCNVDQSNQMKEVPASCS